MQTTKPASVSLRFIQLVESHNTSLFLQTKLILAWMLRFVASDSKPAPKTPFNGDEAVIAMNRLAYTIEETARLLGVSVATIYRAVEAGTLPYKRIPTRHGKGRILIPAVALENWLSKADEPRSVRVRREIDKKVASLRGRR